MADSDLWRDFAEKFLSLPDPHGALRADWQYIVGSGTVGNWTIHGLPTLRIQFEALARRAAIGLPNKRSPDLLVAWLEALREDGPGFEFCGFPTEQHDDGSMGVMYSLGSVRRLCETSANYCNKLESAAIQTEFEEKQQRSTQPAPSAQPEEISRRTFVTPLLEERGWSILDWANEANVSYATAMDYLQDKTKPYRSTRLKLATALGVAIERFPK